MTIIALATSESAQSAPEGLPSDLELREILEGLRKRTRD